MIRVAPDVPQEPRKSSYVWVEQDLIDILKSNEVAIRVIPASELSDALILECVEVAKSALGIDMQIVTMRRSLEQCDTILLFYSENRLVWYNSYAHFGSDLIYRHGVMFSKEFQGKGIQTQVNRLYYGNYRLFLTTQNLSVLKTLQGRTVLLWGDAYESFLTLPNQEFQFIWDHMPARNNFHYGVFKGLYGGSFWDDIDYITPDLYPGFDYQKWDALLVFADKISPTQATSWLKSAD